MNLAWYLADLSGEAITVLAMVLFSLLGWLKSKFFDKPVEPPTFDEEELREVVWRRQMGEDSEQAQMPWEASKPKPTKIRFDQPKVRQVAAPARPPALPKQITKVSDREKVLANAFERSTQRTSGRRTGHRRKIDALLSSPSAAKDAILLIEILGPAVAMKPEHNPES